MRFSAGLTASRCVVAAAVPTAAVSAAAVSAAALTVSSFGTSTSTHLCTVAVIGQTAFEAMSRVPGTAAGSIHDPSGGST